ncbi:hypothetical protein PCAR4_570122 [Paraburkholderia caribensis]|nr:hypothetical protein PCAR4_570122 [Paraburkholderia caribensis]
MTILVASSVQGASGDGVIPIGKTSKLLYLHEPVWLLRRADALAYERQKADGTNAFFAGQSEDAKPPSVWGNVLAVLHRAAMKIVGKMPLPFFAAR